MKIGKSRFMRFFCLAFFFLLTGCVNADLHIRIQKDGSGTYQIKVLSNEWVLSRLTGTKDQLRQQGFQIREIENPDERGWIATKRVPSILDEPPATSLTTINQTTAFSPAMKKAAIDGLEVRNHFFTTTIAYRNVIDLGDRLSRQRVEQWLLKQVDLRFHLTTPIRAREHNATTVQDDGKTLTWKIDPVEPNPIYVMYHVPNPVTWSIILLIAAGCLIMAIFRFHRHKRKKRTGDSPGEPPVPFRRDDEK
ncbi:DUF3153 domain-containing protein [Thermoactinomyces mirandus]|uniref:DUF3153 domain-containing protein n=1 Tax=Thermoactinomyces mirandus TaxID=2756294 RepID=A0A7W1XQ73_9BACL|nr:DUF3153 domain-containing protein [Thermoactinomyces mirandus]MBA4601125.1 DUF3153 domain-containing protein [Thermoactinomyces mirandus]